MDPKFRSSFIPKKSLTPKTDGVTVRRRTSFNMVTLIASIIFIVAVIGTGTLYAYAFILQDGIDQKGVELNNARALLSLEQINEYKLLDERLDIAWSLLRNHKITSAFFSFLEDNTLHNVQFDVYTYDAESTKNGALSVTLEGQAASFEALVLQADALKEQSLISDVAFSEIEKVTDEKILPEDRTIKFILKANLNQKEVTYLTESSSVSNAE